MNHIHCLPFARCLTIFALSATFASTSLAANYSMQTNSGKTFRLVANEENLSTDSTEFKICGSAVGGVNKVKLWMPMHGHGTTPVVVGDVQGDCRTISQVNFTMDGQWQVQVNINDGDSGAFNVSVK